MADISQFQPLFPEERVLGPLQELASELVADCHRLRGQARDSLARALSPRLRAMNSYYTNHIEGQHTHPADIERAIRQEFDADAALAKKQRLAITHIDVERRLEQTLDGQPAKDLFSPSLVSDIHGQLYNKLLEGDRVTDQGEPIVPGEYRRKDVAAGRHVASAWQNIGGADGRLGAALSILGRHRVTCHWRGVLASPPRVDSSFYRRKRTDRASSLAFCTSRAGTDPGTVDTNARICTNSGAVLRKTE